MKTIYLLRHAKSEWANENLEDIDRPLNERGYRDANEMSKRLKEQNFMPEQIIASPAIRTTSTALIFAKNIGYSAAKVLLYPELYNAGTRQYLEALRNLNNNIESVMLVGHNPTITDTANALNKAGVYEFPTCALLALQAPIKKSWSELESCKELFYLQPKGSGVK